MKVRELIELNQMITDIEITMRDAAARHMLDQLNIGPAQGIKPPFPTRVPKRADWWKQQARSDNKFYKDAIYIDKSINSWDDGKDYWQVKPDRVPKKWLELDVVSWEVWPASMLGSSGRRSDYTGKFKNVNFHGQRINIETVPNGQEMEIKTEKNRSDDQIDGQIKLSDWIGEMK